MMYKDVWLTMPMVAEIAELAQNHPRTVERWIERRSIPVPVYELLDVTQNGRLDKIHPNWDGWKICSRTGQLWTPNGEKVHADDIMAIRYRKHLCSELIARRRGLPLADRLPAAETFVLKVDRL